MSAFMAFLKCQNTVSVGFTNKCTCILSIIYIFILVSGCALPGAYDGAVQTALRSRKNACLYPTVGR